MKTTPRPTRAESTGSPPNLLRIRLGASLQKQRLAAGLTQAQVAKKANLSMKYIGEIERGDANTTLEILERLAVAIGWDPTNALSALHEPFSEGVRVMLIELLQDFIQALQQAIRWLEALDPRRSLAVAAISGGESAAAVSGVEHGNKRKPKIFTRRLPGGNS